MHYFVCKLIPPRKTFPNDMSELERNLMRQHGEYWTGHLKRGKVLLFGPVADPDGPYGLCVLALAENPQSGLEAAQMCRDDPIQLGSIGFSFAIFPMPRIVHACA
jgi:hypothetical protein